MLVQSHQTDVNALFKDATTWARVGIKLRSCGYDYVAVKRRFNPSGVARVFAARGRLKNAAFIFAVKIFETLNSETVIKL